MDHESHIRESAAVLFDRQVVEGSPRVAISWLDRWLFATMSNTFAKILENVRDGFNKLTGTPQTPLARQCEDCVADVLTSTPWAGIQDLCTNVNHGDVGYALSHWLPLFSRCRR
jgi:hypothetical protein